MSQELHLLDLKQTGHIFQCLPVDTCPYEGYPEGPLLPLIT